MVTASPLRSTLPKATLLQWLRLYLVTDRASLAGRTLHDVVLAAVQGGVTCVQLRDKELGTRDFYAQASQLMALLAPFGVPLIINDRIDVALACCVQGVHLGQSDMPIEVARALLPPQVFIGWSVESRSDVERATSSPADYLGVSPVFETPTKLDTQPPWGLEGLRHVRASVDVPLVAIGGVDAGNAAEVLAAGADGLAVVRAICSAPDPATAAAQLRHFFHDH